MKYQELAAKYPLITSTLDEVAYDQGMKPEEFYKESEFTEPTQEMEESLRELSDAELEWFAAGDTEQMEHSNLKLMESIHGGRFVDWFDQVMEEIF